ncbi:hypothetical protein GCM10007973_31210 [Polymorphobacter multimanifer]|nr:hypothetical protein GCM10007973_31210 [Polymorphobacter multimanifer]
MTREWVNIDARCDPSRWVNCIIIARTNSDPINSLCGRKQSTVCNNRSQGSHNSDCTSTTICGLELCAANESWHPERAARIACTD